MRFYRSTTSQNLNTVGLLGEKFVFFFIPLGIKIHFRLKQIFTTQRQVTSSLIQRFKKIFERQKSDSWLMTTQFKKGPARLIQRVKIAHPFLQSVSSLFHSIILSLPAWFYIWLSNNVSEPTTKNGEIGRFNLE